MTGGRLTGCWRRYSTDRWMWFSDLDFCGKKMRLKCLSRNVCCFVGAFWSPGCSPEFDFRTPTMVFVHSPAGPENKCAFRRTASHMQRKFCSESGNPDYDLWKFPSP